MKYYPLVLGVSTLLAIILLLAPVYSAPPFVFEPVSGCTITPIARDYLRVGQDFDFNFHVFNSSNGVPLSNTTLSCYFHFYNQTGDHRFSTILKNDPYSEHQVINEWAERMKGDNISTTGFYAYIVQCNSTNIGCVDKGIFMVTETGLEFTTAKAVLDSLIFLFSVLIFFGLLVMGIAMPAKNKTDEMTGYILAVNNIKYLKIVCLGLAYLVAVFISYFCWMMSYAYTSLGFVSDIFRIIFTILVALIIPMFVILIYLMVANAVRDSKISDALSRGLSYKDDD